MNDDLIFALDVLIVAVVVIFALVVAWVAVAAFSDERGRYAYSAHRRALRRLARDNPRRRKP